VWVDLALEGTVRELREKCNGLMERNGNLENDARRNETELEATRVNLERAYECLVGALNGVL
jgi:hypothetical protein